MSEYILLLAASANIFIFGFIIGTVFASRRSLLLKVSKKEDYEEKIKQLEDMMETLSKEPESREYNPQELFAPGVTPEYGLPRKLD